MTSVQKLYESAHQLVRSTRPQDSTTAAYLFKYLLQLPGTHDVIVQHEAELRLMQQMDYKVTR